MNGVFIILHNISPPPSFLNFCHKQSLIYYFEIVESLQSHNIHTMSHWSRGLPARFLSWGTRVQSPGGGGVLMLNRDSPVGLVSLYWWSHMIWSLASLPFSGCFTRLSADNVKSQQLRCPSVGASLGFAPTMCKLTWSHTALLSRFLAAQPTELAAGGSSVESLQSHHIHNMSHWSSGLPVCFPLWGTRVQTPGVYLCETGILLLALSRYKRLIS